MIERRRFIIASVRLFLKMLRLGILLHSGSNLQIGFGAGASLLSFKKLCSSSFEGMRER
jgi:hypothetical protein